MILLAVLLLICIKHFIVLYMLDDIESSEYRHFKSLVEDSFHGFGDRFAVFYKRRDTEREKFEGIINAKDAAIGYGRKEYTNNGSYEGTFWQDEYDGHGIREYANGDRYEGEWKNGKKKGPGTLHYKNGDWYEGEWDQDKMQGTGKFYLCPRDWSGTSRPKWSTGDAWKFAGSFEADMAKDGVFDDGIQNGNGNMRINPPLIPMIYFWIKAKLFKSGDELTDAEKKQMFLPNNLYNFATEAVAPAEAVDPAGAPTETATHKMRLKPLPKKSTSLLLQQLLLIYKPTSSQI